MPNDPEQTRNWAMGAHFSGALVMFFAPSFGFVGPAIIWVLQKDDSRVAYHAMQALYFQLAMTAAIWILGALGTALSCFLIGFVFYFIGLIPWFAGIVMPVMAGMEVQKGALDYRYPLVGHMLEPPDVIEG